MPNEPDSTDPQAWSRYFAVEANNRAWDLASLPTRSAEQARDMLDTAHASAFHWNGVGNELNRVRASYLIAEVHALLGMGESAMARATGVLSYFESAEAPDWERAYVYAIHAHAAAAAGDGEAHRSSYAAAQAALAEVADPEERRIVLQTFSQVPQPGS